MGAMLHKAERKQTRSRWARLDFVVVVNALLVLLSHLIGSKS